MKGDHRLQIAVYDADSGGQTRLQDPEDYGSQGLQARTEGVRQLQNETGAARRLQAGD